MLKITREIAINQITLKVFLVLKLDIVFLIYDSKNKIF